LAEILPPKPHDRKISSLADFLAQTNAWQEKQKTVDGGFLSQLWYRGVSKGFPRQVPGVYRDDFTKRAEKLKVNGDVEKKRLHLEREMLAQFRIAGALFLERATLVEVYFIAQHHGMPTRLLDWSTNPLAALFFACDGNASEDGYVYAMDARKAIPPSAERTTGERLYQSVMSMRHPFVAYAIGLSFWDQADPAVNPHVLPVRPDVRPGRIGQQSSCFTLHMPEAPNVTNATLATMWVEAGRKVQIRDELHKLNVNQFTTYYDLDHLSQEIRGSWGLQSRR
jgi:hypothetical protein